MVEFWACIGLACTDREFLEKLKSNARSTTTAYGFRLSRFEVAELERLVANPGVVAHIEGIILGKCPPQPRPCPEAAARSEGYEEYRTTVHPVVVRAMREKA